MTLIRSPADRVRDVGVILDVFAVSPVVYSLDDVGTAVFAAIASITAPVPSQCSIVIPALQFALVDDSRPRMFGVIVPDTVTPASRGVNQVSAVPAAVFVTWIGVVPVAVFVTAVVDAAPRDVFSAFCPEPPRSEAVSRR